MATSLLMIETSKEEFVPLKWVLCIHYPLYFHEDIIDIEALIDSDGKINTMTPVYVSKLGLELRKYMALLSKYSEWF